MLPPHGVDCSIPYPCVAISSQGAEYIGDQNLTQRPIIIINNNNIINYQQSTTNQPTNQHSILSNERDLSNGGVVVVGSLVPATWCCQLATRKSSCQQYIHSNILGNTLGNIHRHTIYTIYICVKKSRIFCIVQVPFLFFFEEQRIDPNNFTTWQHHVVESSTISLALCFSAGKKMVTDEMGLVQVSFRVVFLHHPSSVATLDTGWLEILLNHQQRMMCGILVILLMEEILHQLIPSRQFIPLSIRIMYIPGGAGVLPSIVSGCVIHREISLKWLLGFSFIYIILNWAVKWCVVFHVQPFFGGNYIFSRPPRLVTKAFLGWKSWQLFGRQV